MKLKKTLLSAILVVAMTMSLVSPAMATVKVSEPEVIDSNETILVDENGYTLVMRGEDYDNGDACVYMIENGNIIYQSYVNRSENQVINTDCKTRQTTYESYTSPYQLATSSSVYSTTPIYKYMGKITYNYYMQGVVIGQRDIRLSCKQYDPVADKYNWAGRYANLAALVGAICGYYAVPTAIGKIISEAILKKLNFATSLGELVLGNIEVQSTRTTCEWLGTSQNSSHNITLSGDKQEFKVAGTECTQYENNYYPPASFTNHNTTFANTCYELMWGNDQFDIVSWS